MATRIDNIVSLLGHATVIWFAILLVAIANGAFRQGVLMPVLGEGTGHVLSTVLLSLAVFIVAWLTIDWIQPPNVRMAWMVGGYWLALTVCFEFLAGHYLFGTEWRVLFADYNVADGRIWPLVLIVTLTAPALVFRPRVLRQAS